jgi:tetratricopeptide (TPR) repeat protein
VLLLAMTGAPAWAQDLAPALVDRFSEAVAALKAENLDEAERGFRGVLAGGGDRAFVHHNLGIVLQRRGRHADAVAEFRIAARQDASFGPAPLLAGASLLALGRPKDAVAELERAAALMPREVAPRLQLADAWERLGDVQRLVAAYRVVVSLAPDEPEYLYRLGKAYLRLSQWAHERIQAIDPHAARLSQALGREYLQQGRPDLARRAFEDALGRDPTLVEVHLALARIHVDEGRWDAAARSVEQVLAILPQSREARELAAAIAAGRAAGPRR